MTTQQPALHRDRDQLVADDYPNTETIGTENVGEHLRFVHTRPSGDRYKIWISGWNPNRPWRTALVTVATTGKAKGQDCYDHHAGHKDLRAAFEWLQALD